MAEPFAPLLPFPQYGQSTYPQQPYNAYPQTQQQSALLPPIQQEIQPALQLKQIKDFIPIQGFTDSTNTQWRLLKSAFDSSLDVPNPKSMQVVSYWRHAFPGLKKDSVFIYVVECVRLPRIETEAPMRFLYQWFSIRDVPKFTPAQITDQEWLRANVYVAPVIDARLSILAALCKVQDVPNVSRETESDLLTVSELNTEHNADTTQHD